MKTLSEITTILEQLKPLLQEKYQIKILGIFGSYVKGKQTEKSDLDILVDYQDIPSLLELMNLECYLSDQVGIKTDVVTKQGLKPFVKEQILNEVIYV